MLTSKIMAHRGLSSLAPENSLSALKKAAEEGCQWVEIDAVACGDGTIVMWHDNSVDRCSDGTGLLSDHNATSITALDCGAWFSDFFQGEKMATIEEAIVLIQSLGLGLNLEFKLYENSPEKVVAPVLALLQKHWGDLDKLIISSFDQAALEYCHNHQPELQLGKLYDEIPENWFAQMQSINAVSCHCNYKLLQKVQVEAIKAAGYEVYCYTPNDPELVKAHWGWGVDAIITDYPQRYNHV
jgi:glycerophosphoryl diester phosphodiesterase|tara:strand:+ start:182 stop:904 length:723 start_codon:yes stop_codon:yes gene_type:complete